MRRAAIVVSGPVAFERFCGRTLIDRHQELLRRAGIDQVLVVPADALEAPLLNEPSDGRLVKVVAERVFDPRLYAAVTAHNRPVRVTDGGIPVGLESVHTLAPRHPRGEAPTGEGPGDDDRGAELQIETLEPYSRELRRNLRPYWKVVSGTGDRPAVARLLVEASGKGHQDLPAMLINAPLEKAAMRRLADTAVTPNQLTGACNLLAYLVAALLATGHLLAGAIGALAVGVVDGLDGRQARIQLRTTPLGRLEHLLDKVYEILWTAALAYTLSDGFDDRSYVTLFVVWLAAYLLDSAAYDVVKWQIGVTLDEASRFDARFRLIAGRRNVYACMLLIGVLIGRPEATFRAIVWWSVVTAVAHGLRAAMITLGRRSRVLV